MARTATGTARVITLCGGGVRELMRQELLIPAVLFLLALTPRLYWIWTNQFDGLYGQDAYAYFAYARQMFDALRHARVPPSFWWPLGYPSLLDLSFLLWGTSIRSAQLITIVSGTILVPAVYVFAREVDGGKRLAALIAAAIVGLSGQAVQSSIVVMSDVPALLWMTLSAWLLLRFLRTRVALALYGSALMMALSIVTRWQDLAFAFAWFCALVAGLGFRPGHRYEKRDAPKTRAFVLLLAFAVAALVLLPQLGYKLVEGAPLAGQSWIEGWRPSNFLARSFDNVDGHFDYALPVALFYAQVAAHPAYIPPLLTPFLVVGVWLLAKRVQAEPELPILFLAWIGTMYLFLAGIPYENFRFGLGFLTPVAVLTGIGVAWTWEKLQAETTASSVLRAALGLLVVVAFAAMTFWQLRALEPVLVQKQMELTHARRLQARLPEGATLYTFGVTGALQVYTGLHVVDLSEELPERIRADTARTSPAYLFLDASNIETQWRGHELAKTFETLRDRVGLTELEQIDRWTLFQIRATP